MDMNTVALVGLVISSSMIGIACLPWQEKDVNEVFDAYAYAWNKVKSLF